MSKAKVPEPVRRYFSTLGSKSTPAKRRSSRLNAAKGRASIMRRIQEEKLLHD